MNGLAFAPPPLLNSWTRIKRWASKARRGHGPRSASTTLGFASLPAADGGSYSMDAFRDSPVLVVAFLSNRCPWVKSYDTRLRKLQDTYWHHGVQVIGINSLDAILNAGEDVANMKQVARRRGFNFPYLKDIDQRVAHDFGATTAPHVVVLDRDRHVRYAGKIDDAFREGKVQQHYLRDALDSIIQGRPVSRKSTTSFGCSIQSTSLPSPTAPSPPRPLIAPLAR